LKNTVFFSGLVKLVAVMLLSVVFLFGNDANAQRRSKSYLRKKNKRIGNYKGGSIHFDKNKRYLNLGVSVDALNYFGDLAPKSSIASTNISLTRPAFSIYGSYRYSPSFSFRASFSWGRLTGDDFDSADPSGEDSGFRYTRNLSFRNDIKELAFVGIYDFFSNHGTFLNRVSFTPYAFAGLAVFHHNPKGKVPDQDKFGAPLEDAGEWIPLRPLGTEGQYSDHYDVKPYSVIQPSIPFGLGIRTKLQKRLDFEFEIGYRFLFTDYIDDVSGMYVDLGALDSELARAMSDRSGEQTSAITGKSRDMASVEALVGKRRSEPSIYDGRTYQLYPGFGKEHPDNNRGMANDKDIYIVTSFKITYIMSGSFRRAKFR
jgi:hypothetical protein